MALRTPALWMGDPAVQHPAADDRLLLSALLRGEAGQTAATRPLAASAGALYGAPGTMGEVTLLSNTQYTVNPARWMVQAASALGGTYVVTNDAVTTLSDLPAQDATQSRKSYLAVWVQDKFVAGSGDNAPHWGVINGALAASNPALPSAGSLPANVLLLGEFLIPATGGSVTWTPYSPRTTLRGGVLPVIADGAVRPGHDGDPGLHVGQYRDHPTWGLERWTAAGLWVPLGNFQGSVTVTPAFGALAAGAIGVWTTAAMTVRAGQRLRIRPAWNWTASTASAQTIQLISWATGGTATVTLLDGDTPAWRLPTASDILNGYITSDVLLDVTGSGTLTIAFNVQIGTGGNTITLTTASKYHYELGVAAP